MKQNDSKLKTGLWQAVFLLLTPLTAVWLMQLTYGSPPWSMALGPTLANALCIALLFWPLCGLVGRIAPCSIGIHIAAGAWGAANYFVNAFRGTPILPWDFSALNTAADVAGSYRFIPTWQMAVAAALMVALILFLHKEERKARLRLTGKRWPLRLVCLGAGLLCLTQLFPTQKLERFSVKTDVWDPAGSYRTWGCLAAFLRNTEFLEVDQPEDPSAEHVAQIMAEAEPPEPAEVPVERPNIVAIMNESWADFAYYGNLSLSESVTDYISSLDNGVYGHAYTSVFGAGTSASEFEFLTGNSMAFLPSGSAPYQQYITQETPSMASLLGDLGYRTLAFHPGEVKSWNRDKAYPLLGFDEMKFRQDLDVPELIEHAYPSDYSDFQQIIWEFEHKEAGEPLFLFNVTYQNHGGYEEPDYPTEVTLTDCPGQYPRAEQYLTLANKTDEYFKELVDYFSTYEEPTIIVMFGDHPPSLEQEFLDKAYGVAQADMTMEQYMAKFQVPFVIWSNRPLEAEDAPQETSLNFLGQYLLEYAGIETDLYGKFLQEVQQQLPVFTSVGYIDTQGKAYSHWETTQYEQLLKDYQLLQYDRLFGISDVT